MSIFNTLQTAVSGMAAQSSKLSSIGDNIANQSTVGYKDSDVQFETLLGDSSPSTYESGGVKGAIRYNITGQGEITSTTTTTNLAIQGNGYFAVQTSAGTTALTRAGAFVPDTTTGDLVNAAGFKLLGYNLTDGSYDASSDTGTLEPISTASTGLVATPSTAATLSVNLPSTADVNASPSGTSYTNMTSLVAYDDLGNAVTLNVNMTKTADNTWDVAVYNAADLTTPLSDQTLTFDPTTGNLDSSSPTSVSVAIPNGNTINIDMSKTTQLASAYDKGTQTIDGNAPSKLSSVTIGNDGTVSLVYASGATVAAYRIPLANVTSPDQMTSESGNIYIPNDDSGPMVLGTANSGTLGAIDSSSLESSTVDLATQLTEMISTQRAYEANSKVLTTGSDMLSTIIQAIH